MAAIPIGGSTPRSYVQRAGNARKSKKVDGDGGRMLHCASVIPLLREQAFRADIPAKSQTMLRKSLVRGSVQVRRCAVVGGNWAESLIGRNGRGRKPGIEEKGRI